MKIKYLGHSCFKLTNDKGIRIMTDPFDESVGYEIPNEEVDIVTTSHDHFDHGYIQAAKGDFEVVNKAGDFNVKDVHISGISTYHDHHKGQNRGSNIVYVFELDGMRVCHLGDLGHIPNDEQLKAIGKVDVLLIPVGGVYTIDGDEAAEVVNMINPKIVIPMHYKTKELKFELEPIDKFLKHFNKIEKINKPEIQLNKEDLTKGTVLVVQLR